MRRTRVETASSNAMSNGAAAVRVVRKPLSTRAPLGAALSLDEVVLYAMDVTEPSYGDALEAAPVGPNV